MILLEFKLFRDRFKINKELLLTNYSIRIFVPCSPIILFSKFKVCSLSNLCESKINFNQMQDLTPNLLLDKSR